MASHRLLASYRCEEMVGTMPSGYKLQCLPSTKSYDGIACMSETFNFLRIRDEAFLPVSPDKFSTAALHAKVRHNNCSLCEHVLNIYGLRHIYAPRETCDATQAQAMSNIIANKLSLEDQDQLALVPNNNMPVSKTWGPTLFGTCLFTVWVLWGIVVYYAWLQSQNDMDLLPKRDIIVLPLGPCRRLWPKNHCLWLSKAR